MRGIKKELSEELGDALVDLAYLAVRLEVQKNLDAPGFEKWFRTVENQVETMNGLVEEIHRMLHASEDTSEDTSLYNPLKQVKIDRLPFVKG